MFCPRNWWSITYFISEGKKKLIKCELLKILMLILWWICRKKFPLKLCDFCFWVNIKQYVMKWWMRINHDKDCSTVESYTCANALKILSNLWSLSTLDLFSIYAHSKLLLKENDFSFYVNIRVDFIPFYFHLLTCIDVKEEPNRQYRWY